jgi:hypothetical protein
MGKHNNTCGKYFMDHGQVISCQIGHVRRKVLYAAWSRKRKHTRTMAELEAKLTRGKGEAGGNLPNEMYSLSSLSLNRITSQTPPCFSPLPRPTYFSLYAFSLLFIFFLLKPTIARRLHAELLWPSHKSQWQGGRGQGLLRPQRGLAAARVKLT